MANVHKMALIESILSLLAQRWSQLRIARELQIDREKNRLPGFAREDTVPAQGRKP